MNIDYRKIKPGLIDRGPVSPVDYVAGDFSPLTWCERVNEAGGFWLKHVPTREVQNDNGVDKMNCTAMATDNDIETDIKEQTNSEINISDRFVAKAAGNTKSGNYVHAPIDAIIEKGFALESEYPEEYQIEPPSWDEYYKGLSEDILKKACARKDEYEFNREFIIDLSRDNLYQRLHESPLKATVCYASSEDQEDILNPTGKINHDVLIVGAKYGSYWDIFDSYAPQRGKPTLKRYAWNYKFGTVMRIHVALKNNQNNMIFKKNYPYLLVEGPEQKLGFFLDGRMVVATGLIEWAVIRENVNSRLKIFQPAIEVKLSDWNSVPHVNLKGETV